FSGRVERFPSWAVMCVALFVGGAGAIGMGLCIDSDVAFLLMSVPAGAGLGLTWSFASVVTQSVAPPAKAGAASGVVLTVLVGGAGVAVAIASSAFGTRPGTPSGVIGDVLVAFGALAVLAVPLVAAAGRRRSA
ncbi:MAG TPA: hypothetical protein VHS03_16400, partial [Gaiellaceae bacterium]|nr:hypothetical protein [Gaiellaceae bacterium]